MISYSISIISIFLLLTFSNSISAQDTLKKNISHNISLGGALQTGNLDLLTVKSTLKTNISLKKIESKTYLQYGFNQTNNSIFKNDIFGYEIVSINPKSKLHLKLAGLYEKSKIKSIKKHYLIGPALGVNILNNKKSKLIFSNLIAFEQKDFYINENNSYKGIRYAAIIENVLALNKSKVIFKNQLFLYPLLINHKNNYRYRVLIDCILPISKQISTKISYDYTNESIYETGFTPINSFTTLGISIHL